MRPQQLTLTATGTSAWVPLDFKQVPFNLGLQVVKNSGTATFTVEYTMDDVWDSTVTPTAFASAISGSTANTTNNIAFPVRAVRLNITAGTTPNVTFTVLQGNRPS